MKNQAEKGYVPLSRILEEAEAGQDIDYAMEVLIEGRDNEEIAAESIQRKGRGIIVNKKYLSSVLQYLASKKIDVTATPKERTTKRQDFRDHLRNLCIESNERAEQKARESREATREACARMTLQVTANTISSREDLLNRIAQIDETQVYTAREVIEQIGLPKPYIAEQSKILGNMDWSQDRRKMGWLGKNVRTLAITYLDKTFPPSTTS